MHRQIQQTYFMLAYKRITVQHVQFIVGCNQKIHERCAYSMVEEYW